MADGDVQGLLVRIEATTAQLRQEMARGESSVAQTAGRMDASLGRIDSAFDRTGSNATALQRAVSSAFNGIGIASAAAVAGLVAITAHTTEYAREVKNLSSLSNSSVTDFQRLAAGAKTVGIEQEKLGDIFKDINDRVGEFIQRGGGEMADFFKEIGPKVGVTAKDFANLSGPQALQLYYNSLEKAGLNQQQLTTYMEQMADESTALIPLLKNNGAGFKQLGDQAERTGKVLSAFDVDRLNQADLAIKALRDSFDGATNRLVLGLLPGIESVTARLTDMVNNGALDTLASGVAFLAEHLNVLAAVFGGKLAASFAGYLLDLGKSATATIQSTAANVANATSSMELAKANLQRAQTAVFMAEKEAVAAKGTAVQTQMSLQLAEARAAERAATAQLATAQTGLRAAGTGVLGLLGGPAGLAALAVGAGIAFLTMRDSTSTLEKKLGDLADPVDKLTERFNKLNKATQAVTLRELQSQIDEVQRKLQETSGGVADQFESDLRNLGAAGADGLMAGLVSLPDDVQGALDLVRKAARDSASGLVVDWKSVADEVRKVPGVTESMAQAIEKGQIKSSDLSATLQDLQAKMAALSAETRDNTSAQNENNASRTEADLAAQNAGNKYLADLGTQLSKLKDKTAAEQAATFLTENRITAESELGKKITEAAAAVDTKKAADEAAKKATDDAAAATKKAASEEQTRVKALTDLKAQADIAIRSAGGLADAYLAGIDKSREFTLQQKVEQELLKTGAAARAEVEKAIRAQADSEDRLAISKQAYDLGKDAADQLALATATLQGADALQAYNVQKAMQVALAGKNIEVGSKEYQQLLDATKAQQAAIQIAQKAGSASGIMDRLYPESKLLKDYTEDQKALNAAMKLYPERADEYRSALQRLGVEYEANRNASTAWGKFTEGAVDRVDGAFADMWKSILGKSGDFFSSFKDSFNQFLAEILHMAITRPIILQIGASLGVGGLAAQAASSGGGSGGVGFGSILNGASSLYSAATGWGKALYTGYQSGGLAGAWSGLGSYSSGVLAGWDQAAGQLFGTISNGSSALTYAPISYQASSGTLGQSVGAGAATYAPYFSAAAGAFMGYQNSGVKGAAAGAAGGYLGAKGGAAIGSYFGPIGTAAGAVIGGLLGSIGGSKLFAGDWVTKNSGIQLGVQNGDLDAYAFKYQKKKGGLFGSNKKRTQLTALDDELQGQLQDAFDDRLDTVFDLFDKLHVDVKDGVLDGLNIAAQQISTQDLTSEQVTQMISDWFEVLGNEAVGAISKSMKLDLDGYNVNQLAEFVNNLYSINDTFKLLNVNALPVSVWGGKLAEQYVALAGGLENFSTATQTYYGAFFSDAERSADTLEAVKKQFADLNITFPTSKQGFRAMVEGIDSTTDAGRTLFIQLMGLAGSASTAYDILAQQQQALVDSAGTSFSTLQRSIQAQQKALTEAYNAQVSSLNDMMTTATTKVSDLTGVSNNLTSALKQLSGTSDESVKVLRKQAQATLQSALATARAGGSLADFSGLSDALEAIGTNSTDLYASLEDFNRDQGETANVVAELNQLNGRQLTSAQQTVKTLQDQLDQAKKAYDAQTAVFDAQLDFAQSQLDALNGVDNSVKSVADAVKAMNAAVVAALAGLGGTHSTAPDVSAPLIESAYWKVLGRDADSAGLAYWQQQLSSGSISYAQLEQAIRNAAKANGTLPAFASGGLISGPGTGTSDSILARVSNGEYMMSAAAVGAYGTDLLDQMNSLSLPAFAAGGPVVSIPKLGQVSSSSGSAGNDAVGQKLDRLAGLLERLVGPVDDIRDNSNKGKQMLDKWDRVGLPAEAGV